MRLEGLLFLIPFAWLAIWIGGSIYYRRSSGKPVFPRAPDGASFAEAWRSGRALDGLLGRIGGARNCLLVYVSGGKLTIVPVFPFCLMFFPEIYGLEITADLREVSIAETKDGMFGERIRLEIAGPKPRRFEVSLNDPAAFNEALAGQRRTVRVARQETISAKPSINWRLIFFRLCAAVWGIGACSFAIPAAVQDLRFRSDAVATTGRFVDHTGAVGSKGDQGILQYEVDGQTYTLTSLRGTGVYRIGDVETVRYMPGNPAQAREDDNLMFNLMFAGIGSVMLIVAATLGLIQRAFTRAMNV